jgi:hypothetical protein
VTVQVGHQLVGHQLVALHQANQVVDHNRARIDLHEVVAQIVRARLDKYLKAVKSVIHAGFGLRHKSGINHESDRASSSQIFQKMSQVKNLKRAYVQNY